MSDQELINVLDYLGEKFAGIGQGVIDWTSETALPYLQDLIQRIITYNIVTKSIAAVVAVIFIILGLVFAKYIIKEYYKCQKNEKDSIYFIQHSWGLEMTGGCLWVTVAMSIFSVVSVIVLVLSLSSLIKWIFIPEVELFSFIQSLIPAAQ